MNTERTAGGEMRKMRPVNIGFGIVFGMALATLYTAYVLALYLFRGNAPFEANEITLGAVIAAYFFGGIGGGIVVGLLFPLTTWHAGSMFVGVVAGLPAAFGIGYAVAGPVAQWDQHSWVATLVTGTLLGGFGGYAFWEPVRQKAVGMSSAPDQTSHE